MRAYFLETAQLGFSRWAAEDLALAESLWGDPSVSRYVCAAGVFLREEIAARLRTELDNLAAFGVQYWPVFWKENGDFVGACGLRPADFAEKAFEFGFYLRPSYWGRGLAAEAGRAALDYARETLGIREIAAGHHPENAASRKVLTKLGFEYLFDSLYPPTGLMHPAYRLADSAKG